MSTNEKLKVVYRKVEELIPYARNARTHSPEQITKIASSIKEFGWTNPILIDGANGIIAGHGRLETAKKLGLTEVPTLELSGLSDAQKRAYILADNRLALDAGWDEELLKIELNDLELQGVDLNLLGFSDSELSNLVSDLDESCDANEKGENEEVSAEQQEKKEPEKLSERFIVPPFSIFRTSLGTWQDRKKQWLSIGIKSEVGRKDELLFNKGVHPLSEVQKKDNYEKSIGHEVTWDEFIKNCPVVKLIGTTSIFDPVLCEIAYKWFSPDNGTVIDPFAGGSVRGIVASACGRKYFGVDLREEQVKANIENSKEVLGDSENTPIWICGDSMNICDHLKGIEADMIFSCPPYADLEVYSDNPKDLSTMKYDEFIKAYESIIKQSASLLKPNRFAVFVVSEVRSKSGMYYGFVPDTIKAFENAGLHFYNEIILENVIGSACIRAANYFTASRKVARIHQNILVFVKGDPKEATKVCGVVDVEVPEVTNEE